MRVLSHIQKRVQPGTDTVEIVNEIVIKTIKLLTDISSSLQMDLLQHINRYKKCLNSPQSKYLNSPQNFVTLSVSVVSCE